VVAEFLAEKEKRTKRGSPASARYIGDLRKRLAVFAAAFQCDLAAVTPEQIRLWADGYTWGARTRFNTLSQIKTLFSFARARGYYPRDEDALAGVEFAKGNGGAIGIFTPAELRRLLDAAKPEIIPFLAIGAFAGLRTAEIVRLDWSRVNLTKRFIEVTAQNAKTASRRIVPITDNLAAWLAPYAKADGPVCALARPEKHSSEVTGRAAKVAWKHNGLRHSFISYRLAAVKDTARVALEAGNSPAMVFAHYREVVHDEQAAEWFAITPESPANVVQLERTAA
jgi:integrase